MSVVLACDLGGTSFRAALVDEAGAIRAEKALPGPASIDIDGGSEIDPGEWWLRLVEACAALAAAEPALFAAIAGIAICGVTRTQVLLGADDEPLRPALTWKDTRSDEAAAALRGQLDGRHPEAANLNAFHPLARLAWLRQAEPDAFAALACVLDPKDYLNLRLTGRRASDAVSLARLLGCGVTENGIDPLAAIGLTRAILPPIREPWETVGAIRPGLPAPLDRLAGIPVFCCANDSWAAATGLGAMRPGHAYNISGTTEVLGVVSERAASAEGLLTVDWRGLSQLGGPSQNGADTVSWLLALLGRDGGAVGTEIEALLAGPRQPQPLLFLPYLQGERVPYWNPSLRGAVIGLGRRHGPADLAWAVLEGIGFLNRVVLERAEGALGESVAEIRFGGGGAANPVWCQVKADICRRPVVVGRAPEPGLLGAAITAWTGLGRFASLAQAQDALVETAARYEPDPARAAFYDGLFALYRRSETALAPISIDLAGMQRSPPPVSTVTKGTGA